MSCIKSLFEHKSSRKKGLIFIHIPKNGGTSIGKVLGINNPSHIKAYEIEKRRGIDFLKNNFTFSVVRNPYARFLSLYNYSRLEVSLYHNNLHPEKSRFGKHLDYETLKGASIKDCAHLLKEGRLKHDRAWNHWDPQYTWLYDRTGVNCLVKKTYRLENLDRLRLDLNDNSYKIKRFPNLNSSNNTDWETYIDSETKEIIMDYYRKDFEIFNYQY